MKLYYYIHPINDLGDLAFTTSPIAIEYDSIHIEIDEKDIEKYELYIKYIDCCKLDKKGNLDYDYMKVLAKKINSLTDDIDYVIRKLRPLIAEAAALGKNEVVEDIKQTIKGLRDFTNSDFSHIKNIKQIDSIICPELSVNYIKYYESEIETV